MHTIFRSPQAPKRKIIEKGGAKTQVFYCNKNLNRK